MSSKRNKNEARKAKERGGEKAKSKRQYCCVTFKAKTSLEVLHSAHSRTSQANIVRLGQKAVKCSTYKSINGFMVSLALYTTLTRKQLG